MTITFSQAVKDPILHLDRIGGQANTIQQSMSFFLLTPGVTLQYLSGTPHFSVNAGTGEITNSQVDLATGGGFTGQSSMTANLGTAAGSVKLLGTFTSVSFHITRYPTKVRVATV